MARTYYDDGSWLDTQDGFTYAANTEGTVVSRTDQEGNYWQAPSYWVDARESNKMDPYTAGDNSTPWWERLAIYGVTRAIDNHIGPPEQNKTSAPATFAGQNGRTYSQVGSPLQGGVAGMGWLPLVAIGALAFLALR